MTTDKTSLGDWAREKAAICTETIGGEEGSPMFQEIEAAIIEGMEAALEEAKKRGRSLMLHTPISAKRVFATDAEALDALKKELRGSK